MSINLRANNSDNTQLDVECPRKGFRYRQFNTTVVNIFIQEDIIYRNRDYVIMSLNSCL